MTHENMVAFEEECRERFGWGRWELLRQLQISHRRLVAMQQPGGRIPKHIAYACAAIVAGLPPYPETAYAWSRIDPSATPS